MLEQRDNSVEIAFNAKWPRDLSFDNPLVGVLHHKKDISFNFVLANGEISTYPCEDLDLE